MQLVATVLDSIALELLPLEQCRSFIYFHFKDFIIFILGRGEGRETESERHTEG